MWRTYCFDFTRFLLWLLEYERAHIHTHKYEREREKNEWMNIWLEKMLNLFASLSWYVFVHLWRKRRATKRGVQHLHPCHAAWFGYMKPLSRFKKVCTWANLNTNQTITSGNMPIHATDAERAFAFRLLDFASVVFFSSSSFDSARKCETTKDSKRQR